MTFAHRRLHLAAIACGLMVGVAHADLQIDVGGDAGLYAGTDAPAQAEGRTVAGSWVEISENIGEAFGTDGAPAIVMTQDSNMNPIELDLGRAADDSALEVSWKDNRWTQGVGAVSGSGVFGTSLTLDAQRSDLFRSSDGMTFPRGPIGLHIQGLPAGDYDVYVVAHYADNVGTPLLVAIGAWNLDNDRGGDSNEVAPTALSDLSILSASTTASWVEDDNYAKATVTVDGTNPFIVVAVGEPVDAMDASMGVTAGNGSISAVQILPAGTTPDLDPPEIASWATVADHGSGLVVNTLMDGDVESRSLDSLQIVADEPLDGASVNTGSLTVTASDDLGSFTPPAVDMVSVTGPTIDVTFASALPFGQYTVELATSVADPAGNVLAGDRDITFNVVPGDVDGSELVDLDDFAAFNSNLGAMPTTDADLIDFDTNADGVVDDIDFDLWKDNYLRPLFVAPA